MFEHVGISSLDIITELEVDGAACLVKRLATECGVGTRSGVRFRERMV